jgi:Zn-dependent metalloprotease
VFTSLHLDGAAGFKTTGYSHHLILPRSGLSGLIGRAKDASFGLLNSGSAVEISPRKPRCLLIGRELELSMMKPFKWTRILAGYRFKLPIQQGISRSVLAGFFIALALASRAWAIDLSRSTTNPAPAATSTNRAPDLDQLTRDLQRFLGGARAAALQRGAGQKAAVNTVKDPATNAQPAWSVTAAENGAARQIKRVGRPAVSGPVQAKAKRTEAETMAMVRSFLSSQSPALKLRDPIAELAQVSSETDSLGYRHFRYTQKLEEIPVWPTGLTVHLAPDGELHLITASIVPTPSAVSRVPGIEADKAVERAKAKVPGGFRGTHTTPELILHWDSDATANAVRLAWKFRVSVGEHASWTAIMDAQTGGEISIQSDARTGSVMGSGTDLFGVTKTFPVWEQGGVYYMIDTTKPSYNGAPDPLSFSANGLIRVLSYDGTTNVKNYVTSARKDEWVLADAVNAYGNIRSAFDYFLNSHARLGLADFGTTVSVYVRNGDQGLKNNATYQNGSITFYLGEFPKAKSLDVAAHEFTHGVIQYSSGLEYENQSGALNESFSDIFGEMVELSVKGTNDWLIGADSGVLDRDMSNPGAVKTLPDWYPYPSKMSEYWGAYDPKLNRFDKKDRGGVHINSSIINKSYYNLCQTIKPEVAAKIYYRCLVYFLKPKSKFIDCRLGCVSAAEELYPSDPSIKRAVEEAFNSVEIYDGNPTPTPGSFPPVNAADSYLVLYRKIGNTNYSLARREGALLDNIGQSYTKLFDSVGRSKPFVSGDGSIFVFVTSENNIAATTTSNPVQDLNFMDFGGSVKSVAFTPDVSVLALALKDTNQLILKEKLGSTQIKKIYSPGSEGVLVDNIKYADVISCSPDGRYLVYDALTQEKMGDASVINRWSIYLMEIATGQIWHLINSGDDYDVGNPSFGHTSNNFITYERINWKTGVSKVMVFDQFSNRHSEVATLNGLGFPEFNGDDSALVFSDTDSTTKATGRSLFKVRLDKNRQLVAGTRSLAIQEASMAVVYRRGAYRTTNEPPTVTWTSPTSGSSVAVGGSVTFAVSAADQDGIDRVEFWQGGKKLGEVSQPPFALSVPMTSAGTFGIVARAFDTYGASADSASIQVTVVPALFAKVADQAVDEGTLFRLDLGSAAGTKPGLAFSLVSGPSGLSISSAGILTWTPTEDQGPSLASVEIAATDGISRMTDRFSVQVREVHQPPVLSPVPTLNAKAGVELNYTLQASDPDRPAQGLSFALESGPSGLTVSSGGAVRWTPTLSQISTVQSVTVSVSDGVLKATTQFSIQVGSDPLPVSPTNVVWSVDGIAGNFVETPDGNIVAGGNGLVRCFSGYDGKEIWKFSVSDANNAANWELLPGYIDDDGAVVGKYKKEVFNPVYTVNQGLFVLGRSDGVLRFNSFLISTNTDYNGFGVIRGLRHRELLLQSSAGIGVYEIGKGFRWKRSGLQVNEGQWVPLKDCFVAAYGQAGFTGTGAAAYNYSDGNIRWISSPVGGYNLKQMLFDGVGRIIIAKAETTHAIDAFTGQELWRTGGGWDGEDSLVLLSKYKTLDRYFYYRNQTVGYGDFIDIRTGIKKGSQFQVSGRLYGGLDSGNSGGLILSSGSRIVKINSYGTNIWPFLPGNSSAYSDGDYIASIGLSGVNWVIPKGNDIYYIHSVLQNGRVLVSGYTGGKLMALQGEGASLSTDSPWPHRLRTAPRFGNYGVFGLGSADSGLTSLYSFDGHADDLVSACDAPEGSVGTAGFAASGGPRAGYLKPDRGSDTRFDSGFMRTNSTSKALAVWIRLPDLSAGSVKLLDGGDEDPSGFAGMNLSASAAASGTQVTFNLGAGASASWQAVSAVSPKRSRQWVHVTAVLNDSGVQQLYLDGVLAASAAGRSSKAISRTSTAAMTLPAAVGFDDLRTYLRTVTADEVAQIFAAADPVVEPPVIVTQPVASSVNAGATAVFSVVATGTAPFTYQWRRNGGDLAGETNATLTLAPVQAANAGDYSVVVGNSAGSITSAGAALAVNTPPTFVGLRAASVPEGSELSVQLVTADSDLPAQKLTVRLLSGPTGLVVSPQGLVSWIPTEAQGPRAYPVVVEVSDGLLSATNQFFVSVSEVNRPPVINLVASSSIGEGAAWSQTLTASDPDLPANTLTFRLVSGPSGASVDSKSGILSWTPSEADGGSAVDFVVEVVDDGQPPLAAQTTVRLTVNEVNSLPTLADLADATVPEGVAWSRAVRAMDSDVPAQTLKYALKASPPGMTLDASTGELRWTPSESQGPGSYPVTVSVTDSGGAAVERSFTVTVTEINQPPQVDGWADQRIVFGQSVSLKMAVTDADLPANRLTYRMVEGPTNLVLSEDGRLIWTPARNQAPSTNRVSVAVSDGTASVTNSVRIEVFELVMAVNGTEATEAVNAPLNPRVSFRCGRPDWLVFYTLTGQTPTADLPSKFYQDPFVLPLTATVWPIAFSPDFSDSILGLPVRVAVLKGQTLSAEGGLGLIHLGPGVPIEGKSDSGLPVTLSVISGPGRLESGRLIPTGGGVIRLRAMQTGNDTWAPAQTEFERTVARAAQTVVWQPMDAAVFGGSPLRLRAVASSGLPIEYLTLSGPGSVSGDQLQVTGAGEVVLRARQTGNADFDPATADLAVSVAKAPQTIQWDGIVDRSFSSEVISLNGKASSGLGVNYEVISGPAAISNDRLTVTGVGTVVIRASQAGDANWQPAPVRQISFVVSKVPQTLVFGPIGSKTFGDAPVTLSASSSAGLPVTFSVVSGPGSLVGNRLSLNGAGDVVVQVSQPGDDLHQAASVTQTVTVARASQALSWSPESSLTYRTNLIALDAKASSGLPAGYGVVSGPGSFVGGQLSLTGVGALVVVAEQPGDANWLAALPVTNRFTVGRGVQVVTFEPIGDQTLGAGPVTLVARASSGLPVTFSVISGPAAVDNDRLAFSAEGVVTVRAINPGSSLWLSASADQTITVRKQTRLAVTVAGNLGGAVAVSPVKDQYLATDTVTLTATPASGFAFSGWSGDLTGSANPVSLSMAANRSVVATFKDIAPPTVMWELPVAGTTGVELFRLLGKVSDNSTVATVLWSRDGGLGQPLPLGADGSFKLENLVLASGTNRFALVARDAAGNEARLERDVVWMPQRILRVAVADSVQEGQRLVFPLELTSPGDVAGLTFELRYDPTFLADPQIEWSAAVGQSVNNVNATTPGKVAATFSMAGSALPGGIQRLATVSFRGRSVPAAKTVDLEPRWVSASSSTGALLANGNAVVTGSGRIVPRRIQGDNNANQRIDIGDAVLISRLQVELEEVRPWDVTLNDLNGSGLIDNGDVVKALRTVVGLDPQPTSGSEAKRFASALGLAKAQVNTNDAIILEAIDGPVATVGQPYRIAIRLNRVRGSLSGLRFTLNYPNGLNLTDKQVGALVPSDAMPFWNDGAGKVNLAAIRSTPWPGSVGVAAVFTFVPGAAFGGQAEWPIRLDQAEITGSGFDVRPLDPVTLTVRSQGGIDNRPSITLAPPKPDGTLGLEIIAPQGATIAVEATSDLSAWTETQRITGQGSGNPVKVTLQADPNVQARFWRVRVR